MGGVRVKFAALGPKEQVTRTHTSLRQLEIVRLDPDLAHVDE